MQQTSDTTSRRLILWLLVFLYFIFIYNYGVKLPTLVYTDFPSFYNGVKLAIVQKQSPYDNDALRHAAFANEPPAYGHAPPTIYPYLYPPPSLLLFAPLAHMNANTAKVALLAANHICLLAVMAMLMLPIAGFRGRELLALLPAFLIIYMVWSRGTVNTIELGQVNLLVLALLCVTWWGLVKDWPQWVIALPLALAAVFKIYPLLFLALLLFRRKYIAIAATVVFLFLLCAAAYLVLPKTLWHQWAFDVVGRGGYLKDPAHAFPPTIAQNIGLAGFTSRLFLNPVLLKGHPAVGRAILPNPRLGTLLTYALVACAICVTCVAAFVSSLRSEATDNGRRSRLNLEFAAFLILNFLVAPLAWEHHLAYVTPAVVIALLLVLRDRPAPGAMAANVLLFIACLLGWPLSIGKLPLPRVPQILAVSLKLYAVLALWGFLLYQMLKSRSDVSRSMGVSPVRSL